MNYYPVMLTLTHDKGVSSTAFAVVSKDGEDPYDEALWLRDLKAITKEVFNHVLVEVYGVWRNEIDRYGHAYTELVSEIIYEGVDLYAEGFYEKLLMLGDKLTVLFKKFPPPASRMQNPTAEISMGSSCRFNNNEFAVLSLSAHY